MDANANAIALNRLTEDCKYNAKGHESCVATDHVMQALLEAYKEGQIDAYNHSVRIASNTHAPWAEIYSKLQALREGK